VNLDAVAAASAVLFVAVCAVLAAAGVTKLVRPSTTGTALVALGLPSAPGFVRALGALECVIATSGLLFGGRAALAVAACYAALAIAALGLLVRAPGTACGCLGGSEAPVTPAHVVLDTAAAVVATFAAGAGSPLRYLSDDPVLGMASLMLAGCAAWLAALLVGRARPEVAAPATHSEPRTGA
jgi:hypothetical protein